MTTAHDYDDIPAANFPSSHNKVYNEFLAAVDTRIMKFCKDAMLPGSHLPNYMT